MDETVKWTNLTCSDISVFLARKGFKVSHTHCEKTLEKTWVCKTKSVKKSLLETTEIVMLNLNVSTN